MKRVFLLNFLFSLLLFGEFNPNICATYMGDSAFSAKPKDNCVIDDKLKTWIKCRTYFEKNMMEGLDYHGDKEVQDNPTFMYDYFDKEIKKVLLTEVKKVIEKSQDIMCIKNTEDDLFRYQMSIAEHEWCYAPRFLEAFNDEFMSEHEMKYKHFLKLYNTRSDMLESKEKPKNKGLLCGAYLECMSSFIGADHTQVSNGLLALYKKTKKECKSNYFTITTRTEYRQKSRKQRPAGAAISGPKVLTSSFIANNKSKQIMYIDPKNGIVKLVGLKSGAKSRYESEKYIFDKKQCAFIHKRDETKVDNNPQ